MSDSVDRFIVMLEEELIALEKRREHLISGWERMCQLGVCGDFPETQVDAADSRIKLIKSTLVSAVSAHGEENG